jgi:translation initiation factor 1
MFRDVIVAGQTARRRGENHVKLTIAALSSDIFKPRCRELTMPSSSSSRLVYSTDAGRTCPQCRQALADCRCKALAAARPAADGPVRVSRESKGRGGKTVTLVRGLALAEADLAALGKRLRTACGSGGTAKDGVLEIQGDHRERVLALLLADGIKAKAAGG